MKSGSRKLFEGAGYDHEEMYFHKMNQALIEKKKRGGTTEVQSAKILEFKKREERPKQPAGARKKAA